jgi:thiol-disulfide isomerase/thioredoxin
MNREKIARYFAVAIALLALAWAGLSTYMLGRSIWRVAQKPGPVTWSFANGDFTVQATNASVSLHVVPVVTLVVALPLGIAVASGLYLRRTPRRTLFATMGVYVGAVALAIAGVLLTRTKPDEWVGRRLPRFAVDYLAAKPEVAGHPVLLEFWATWCGPCVASIPHLNELHAKFKDTGLAIVGVSNEQKAVVEAFLKKTPMHYAVALDHTGTLLKDFGVTGIPHAFLADRGGKIVWQGHPYTLTEAQVAAALK